MVLCITSQLKRARHASQLKRARQAAMEFTREDHEFFNTMKSVYGTEWKARFQIDEATSPLHTHTHMRESDCAACSFFFARVRSRPRLTSIQMRATPCGNNRWDVPVQPRMHTLRAQTSSACIHNREVTTDLYTISLAGRRVALRRLAYGTPREKMQSRAIKALNPTITSFMNSISLDFSTPAIALPDQKRKVQATLHRYFPIDQTYPTKVYTTAKKTKKTKQRKQVTLHKFFKMKRSWMSLEEAMEEVWRSSLQG